MYWESERSSNETNVFNAFLQFILKVNSHFFL